MSWLRRLFAPAVLLIVLAVGSPASAAEITVFAAASLADAVSEIGKAFAAASGHHVAFNFGASSDLARQIRAGAPADVFFSADEAQMDVVTRAGAVRATDRVDLLSNTLVVVVPARTPRRLRAPSEIANFERLALADPQAVPAGVYAKKYLEQVGVWSRLADRIVPTLNVRGALAAVASENVPAAIVYRTDAATSSRVAVAFEVPRAAGPPIVYVMAPLAQASGPARLFADELASARATRVYQKYGFIVLTRT
ncbi:MAG TPA: molybdate ABC transporter substrate-binding protein [Vicinamibacteria bacterium]|nr:molybdate ABC transporter substrate-binding protein [Vicinamibacteria bacterium]